MCIAKLSSQVIIPRIRDPIGTSVLKDDEPGFWADYYAEMKERERQRQAFLETPEGQKIAAIARQEEQRKEAKRRQAEQEMAERISRVQNSNFPEHVKARISRLVAIGLTERDAHTFFNTPEQMRA